MLNAGHPEQQVHKRLKDAEHPEVYCIVKMLESFSLPHAQLADLSVSNTLLELL